MALDLARLLALPGTLGERRDVRVSASVALADAVRQRTQRKGLQSDGVGNVVAAPSKSAAEIRGLPSAIAVRPIEILHAAGRLTAGTDGPLSPVSALWPVIRYAWIFSSGGGSLCLTADAIAMRARLRGALSETLGIGLGAMLTRTALRARLGRCSVELVDAEMAVAEESVNAGGRPVSVRRRGSVCPDYVAWAIGEEGSFLGFYTLETKGLFSAVSRGPSAPALDVLRDSTVQTLGLQIGNIIPGGYGFCACVLADASATPRWGDGLDNLQQGEVIVLGVDPDEHEAPLPTGEAPVLRRPGGGWVVRERERFLQSARNSVRAQLLLWAGAEEDAREILHAPRAPRRGSESEDIVERSDELGEFEGVELRIGALSGGPGLRIFAGVAREVLEATRSGDDARLEELRRARATEREIRDDGFEVLADGDIGQGSVASPDEPRRAVSVHQDGTRLKSSSPTTVRVPSDTGIIPAARARNIDQRLPYLVASSPGRCGAVADGIGDAAHICNQLGRGTGRQTCARIGDSSAFEGHTRDTVPADTASSDRFRGILESKKAGATAVAKAEFPQFVGVHLDSTP